MKLFLYLSFISLGLYLATAKIYKKYETFIPLIKRIRSLYSSSAVVFAHPRIMYKDIDALALQQLVYTWCRLLGTENVATLSIAFDKMYNFKKYNIGRPLIIVLITGPTSFQEFSLISKTLKMSHVSWFVIFIPTPLNKIHDHCYHPSGNPFHLSFNSAMLVMCQEDYVLREWYSVDGKSTEIFELARWYPDKYVNESLAIDMLTDLSLYERRNNLKGTVLRGVTVKNSVLLKTEGSKMNGFFGKVISELENALNFTITLVAEVQDYGSFNMTTKRWSGAMRLVALGAVDIGVSDFSMTNIRLDYVDYTIPLLTTRIDIYIKQPEFFAVKWFAYYKTFSFTVWMSIVVTIIIAQCVLTFIRYCIGTCHVRQTMHNEFIRTWGIFCQQGLPEFPQNSSLRVAYFTIFITGIVMYSAYSASLICFLTARIRYVPFYTIEEFIKDGSYSLIVTRDTADYDMFAHSKDPLSLAMMKLMKPLDRLPEDVQTGYEDICKDDKLAFYTGYNLNLQKRSTRLHVPCRVLTIKFGRVDSLSMILSKNNQYTAVLNYHMQKLLSTGVLNRYKQESNFEEKHKIQAVEIGSIMSVLIVFFSSVALAFIILIVEICYDKYKRTEDFDHPFN